MPEKKTKSEVAYTPHAEKHNERCALCRFFIPSAAQCHRVAGTIVASGWCELFERDK